MPRARRTRPFVLAGCPVAGAVGCLPTAEDPPPGEGEGDHDPGVPWPGADDDTGPVGDPPWSEADPVLGIGTVSRWPEDPLHAGEARTRALFVGGGTDARFPAPPPGQHPRRAPSAGPGATPPRLRSRAREGSPVPAASPGPHHPGPLRPPIPRTLDAGVGCTRLVPALALALAAQACTSGSAGPGDEIPAAYADRFTTVLVDASASVPTQLAVHACAGLHNRRLGGSVFVETAADVEQSQLDGVLVGDAVWLDDLGLEPSATVGYREFLDSCVGEFNGCVRYDYDAQQAILPSILTLAAALGAVPLIDAAPTACADPVVDATQVFADKATPLEATEYVYQNHLSQTTGLAMLNPGFNRDPDDLADPDIDDDMSVALIDLVFSRRLFVVFLINGCTDGHPEEILLTRIVSESGWPTPVGVYGYNDSWLVGGYLWEAQTRCLDTANMGAIPTRTTNLSFFDTRRPAITEPEELAAIEPERIAYDPDKTYVAFVVGDGDNVRYIMSTRRDWLTQRLDACGDAATPCPPLNWSISPHLPDLAPDVLAWYYQAAQSTGADYFVLPPSGYQYAYPAGLNDGDQAVFAAETEHAGHLLGTRSVVHWEWLDQWQDAVDTFLPRYAHAGGQIRGIFPMNVPYLLDAFPDWPADKLVEVLEGADGEGRAALFRSHSWRGVDGADEFHLTPQGMADKLAALPKGSVTWMYMTSDGGLTLENSYFELLPLLPEHVQLTSADAAAELAIDGAGS
ncbi:hypothetical protein L6R50_21680 [Myxococcota bacterium]|nr:hypothetical protein [Myxococcota bacterium]